MGMQSFEPRLLSLRRGRRLRRWWHRVMLVLAAVVVFVTTYLLILPAITMEHPVLELSPLSIEAAPGEAIGTEVYARAGGTSSTTFLLLAQGENAGLLEEALAFDGGTATVYSTDGTAILFHGDTGSDGVSRYWFTLEPAETACFTLSWQNGVTLHGWEDAEVPEPEEANEPEETAEPEEATKPEAIAEPEEIAEPSDDVFYAEEDFAEDMLQSSLPITEIAPEEPEEPLPPAPEAAAAPMRLPVERVCGDPAQPGTLTLFAAAGTDLTGAEAALEPSCTLTWAEAAEPPAMPEEEDQATPETVVEDLPETDLPPAETSDEAWATVQRRTAPMARFSLFSFFAQPMAEDGLDFTPYIEGATFEKNLNGTWQKADTFTDGDAVQISISYRIPANTVTADQRVIYYDLPEGIAVNGVQAGHVTDQDEQVGTFTIGNDGRIVITFDEAFAIGNAFTGDITFHGSVHAKDDGTSQEIQIGKEDPITVLPGAAETDISLIKTGTQLDDGTLSYQLTVSTTKGTEEDISVQDWLNPTGVSAAYQEESFQIQKVDADGNRTPMDDDYAPTVQNGSFSISGLPKLNAGEQYLISYQMDVDITSEDGSAKVGNSASASSGTNHDSKWNEIILSNSMVAKTGYLDSKDGKLHWTITVNPDQQDISGFILRDSMTIDGKQVTLPTDTQITRRDSSGASIDISLPYTFPAGSSDTYTITYVTDAPADVEPGDTWRVENEATVQDGDETYTHGTTITGQAPDYKVEKYLSHDQAPSGNSTLHFYTWQSRITVPANLTEPDPILYTDTLHPAAAGGLEIKGSHYTTAQLLGQMTVQAGGMTLEPRTHYQILDESGADITGNTDDTPLTRFQVRFLPAAISAIAGKTIDLRYQSLVDESLLEAGSTYEIRNTAAIPGHTTESTAQLERQKGLEKEVSASVDKTTYGKGPITIDYEQGIIYYRLLLHTTQETAGNITVSDILPAGTALVNSSINMEFYFNDYYSEEKISWRDGEKTQEYIANEHIACTTAVENGRTQLTFTIEEGYNGDGNAHTLAIYYQLSFADDPIWSNDPGREQVLYENNAQWGGELASVETAVEREVPEIKKDGAVIKEEINGIVTPTNRVQYRVIINAGEQNIDPSMDYIVLKDRLDLPDGVTAILNQSALALYDYDPAAENDLGQALDARLYSYTFQEQTRELTLRLPDERACVLVYEYQIQHGSVSKVTLKNNAYLLGGQGEGSSFELEMEQGASATATQKTLTIYKVDATNYALRLPGATFQLSEFLNGEWSSLQTFTTDQNGTFALQRVSDEQSGSFQFQDSCLYRLQEITPRTGYAASATAYYFVWVSDDQTIEAVRTQMENTIQQADIELDAVRFYQSSASIYVPNEPTALTVQKLWQDHDGHTTEQSGAPEVEVALYQQATESNAVDVTVTSGANPDTPHPPTPSTFTISVAQGSPLTITINDCWLDVTIQIGEQTAEVSKSNGTCTYTIDQISTDLNVSIYPTRELYQFLSKVSFSGYVTPTHVPVGEATQYGNTVILDAAGNWSYTWDNLPKTSADGAVYYYYVREVTELPGYEVSYSKDLSDGVQTGEIYIINRAGSGYVLPETGGPGAAPAALGGTLCLVLAGLWYRRNRRKERRDAPNPSSKL